MLIRWSLWGRAVSEDAEMLNESIWSFRQRFRRRAEYVVLTDDAKSVTRSVGALASVKSFSDWPQGSFDHLGTATWRKWCPIARLAPGETEIHVDSDAFLVGDPDELRELAGTNKYLAMQEVAGASWQRGVFADQVPTETPFINAGFFVQGPFADISEDLRVAYDWWHLRRATLAETFHDEQGGLTKALVPAFARGQVHLLPESRYKVVSPRSNAELRDLRGVVLFHATHPGHPAWHRFREAVRISGQSSDA